MAFHFFYFLLSSIFFLPSIHCSCWGSCGRINISHPFPLRSSTSPTSPPPYYGPKPVRPIQHVEACDGILPIICVEGPHHNTVANIEIGGRQYVVMNISYDDTVLTVLPVQDQTLGNPNTMPCGFFLKFINPLYDYEGFLHYCQPPDFKDRPPDCGLASSSISQSLSTGFTDCSDYSLYYWDEADQHGVADICKSNGAAAEMTLSFSDGGQLSLLSVGFSQHVQLRDGCFNCQAGGKSCISNTGPVNSTCSCGTTCKKKSQRGKKIIGIVGAFVGFLLVSLSMALYLCKHPRKTIIFCEKNLNDSQNIEDFLEEYGSVAPKRYTYSQVNRITKAFKEKLGQGGYGTVFKGTLSDGHVVAVKKLNDSRGNGEEFLNEVASIGRTSHVNIVSLRGFCSEGRKRALIYDFMCNGSLEKLLYTDKPKTILDWEKLYQIAIGIARGLEYLHRGCNTRIVHFDIKPHNILLDQDFCPKISDFGLAKLCLMKDSIISIAGARGTIGYIAPEIFSRNFGVVSSKSDVYSYGMMVLEMAEGRKKPCACVENSSEMYFPHWIYEHLNQNRDLLTCGVNAESEETIRKMILVGLWCIQTLPQNRPSMSRVIEMLEGSVNDLQVPPKPYLSSSPLGSLLGSSSIQDICSFDDCS